MVEERNKLALGTVQFGLDYGITNIQGKVRANEVRKIIDTCKKNNISTLDTAFLYGDSEKVLGDFLEEKQKEFRIISKLPPCSSSEVHKYFLKSLSNLKADRLYGYMMHNYEAFLSDRKLYKELAEIQKEGFINKIGFSLYHPWQLEELFEQNLQFQLVQIPYNILDQRFHYILPELRKLGIEVHIRSVFLQGLLLTDYRALNSFFMPLQQKIRQVNKIANDCEIKLSHLLLSFAHLNENIDKIVIGVTSDEELLENLDYVQCVDKIKKVLPELYALAEENEQLILPTNWK